MRIKLYEEWTTSVSGDYEVNYGEPEPEMSEIVRETIKSVKDLVSKRECYVEYRRVHDELKLVAFIIAPGIKVRNIHVTIEEESEDYILKFNDHQLLSVEEKGKNREFMNNKWIITEEEYNTILNLFKTIRKNEENRRSDWHKDEILDEIEPFRRSIKKFNV